MFTNYAQTIMDMDKAMSMSIGQIRHRFRTGELTFSYTALRILGKNRNVEEGMLKLDNLYPARQAPVTKKRKQGAKELDTAANQKKKQKTWA